MTTIIAVRGEGLYSDSKCTSGVNFQTRKLHKVGKSIIGGAGALAEILKFVEWFGGECKGKCKIKNTDIIVMNKRGIYLYDGSCQSGFEILDNVYAIGSGSVPALAALKQGASPREALKIAEKLDNMTGGKMQFLPFKK